MVDTLKDPAALGVRPSHVEGFDKYGFAVFTNGHNPDAERCHQYSRCNEDEQLLQQWEKVMSQPDWKNMHGCPTIKIQKMIRQGVPTKVRADLWTKLLDADTLRANSQFDYPNELAIMREQLVDYSISEYGGPETVSFLYELELSNIPVHSDHITFDCLRQILLDLDRTYPTHKLFMNGRAEGIEGRAALFRLLATYARYNKEVAYCQGMSYLGGIMLMVMKDEERAFWGLVSMLERFKYLRGYYDQHMERIQRHVMVLTCLLRQRAPALHSHLENLGITPLMFATPWFLCLYTSLGCWDTVLAIWDLFMLDGAVTIFRVALGIISLMEECILASQDISQLLPLLLHPSYRLSSFLTLMPAVYDVHIEDWEVAKLEAVVMEDRGLVENTGPRRRKRSIFDEPATKRRKTDTGSAPAGTPTPTTPGVSLFQRFVNIFTPREQKDNLQGVGAAPKPDPRHPVTRKRPPTRPRTAVRVHQAQEACTIDSPSKYIAEETTTAPSTPSATTRRKISRRQRLIEESENDAPGQGSYNRRKSPRIMKQAAPLRDLNTPSSQRLVGSAAQVQYSFKHFTTPKPLRQNQCAKQATPGEDTTDGRRVAAGFSPLEMKPLLSCKTQ